MKAHTPAGVCAFTGPDLKHVPTWGSPGHPGNVDYTITIAHSELTQPREHSQAPIN